MIRLVLISLSGNTYRAKLPVRARLAEISLGNKQPKSTFESIQEVRLITCEFSRTLAGTKKRTRHFDPPELRKLGSMLESLNLAHNVLYY